MSERHATLSKLEKVPQDPPPAEESVSQIVSSATACENLRHRNRPVRCLMHTGKAVGKTVSSATACKILRHRNQALRCMM